MLEVISGGGGGDKTDGAHTTKTPTLDTDSGLNSMELEVSVPSSDLLGVSGLRSEESGPGPEPNIICGSEAGVVWLHLLASALRAPAP